jgi:hypothetical protein
MELPRPIYDTWKAVADKFIELHKGSDDDRREATKRGTATIRARHKGTGELDGRRYVCKTEHASIGWPSMSKDALAFVPEGPVIQGLDATMHMFDMVNGGSRQTYGFPIHSHNHDPGEKYNPTGIILIPEAKDWLDDGNVVNPVEPIPGDTHRYMGGGNDTGTCDECGKPRMDAVHHVPEGRAPHTPWRGEDEKGDCDICLGPVEGNPLHGNVIPGGPGDDDPDDPGQEPGTNEPPLDIAAIRAIADAAVAEALKNISVDITVKEAGPTVKIPFMSAINLSHTHGVLAVVTFKGKEIARTEKAIRGAKKTIVVKKAKT